MNSATRNVLIYTWGLPMSLIGLGAYAVLRLKGKKPSRHEGCPYFVNGKGWGGVSLGCVFIVAEDSDTEFVKNHEYGHTVQNAMFGPLFPFIVAIPSAIRYWWRIWRTKHGKSNPDYYSIWFEAQANELGGN